MSTTITTAAPGELTPDQLELQQRAAEFVDNVLIPLELEAEDPASVANPSPIPRLSRLG